MDIHGKFDIACEKCGKKFDFQKMHYICPECNGIYTFSEYPIVDINLTDNSKYGISKYLNFIGLERVDKLITLGEGETSLIADKFCDRVIYHKMESLNPTGSYKDRGSFVLVNYLKQNNINTIVEDSSGNAGASLAAYSARAGIKAKIYIPESTSGPKKNQIEAYGADIIKIPGGRAKAAEAVLKEARNGKVYASHAYNPLGLLGISTIAFELFEELTDTIRIVIMPIGHGGLMLGVMRGFEALLRGGYISKLPFFVGVQSKLCSPVANLYDGKRIPTDQSYTTLAEGVRVTEPIRGKEIVTYLGKQKGIIIRIDEKDILPSYMELSRLGIHVEPTSALVWAALKHLPDDLNGPTVLIQTGSGLKYIPM